MQLPPTQILTNLTVTQTFQFLNIQFDTGNTSSMKNKPVESTSYKWLSQQRPDANLQLLVASYIHVLACLESAMYFRIGYKLNDSFLLIATESGLSETCC